ncbi:MAG: putative resolvase [Satyrvirus sp.]|uniref:Putative resolvase n=1 Tax=Satyrvirus sp. TaxID=2487771 RepID=A0A3G5AFG4_9VIRU|nr:MAG: putative resolvase [Satyrvirus sp.]
MPKYLGGKQTSEILGVHQRTLYQWEKKGWIKTVRTNGGKRLYDIEPYLKQKEAEKEKLNICYVRVSSNGQKNDLERQIKYMKKKYPQHIIIKDIASGINLNRKGLNKIIDLAIEGKINELVVAYKDRLTRFGFKMIERIIEKYSNGKIKIINKHNIKEPKEELIEDVLQVMNVFVAKMNGMRKYKN